MKIVNINQMQKAERDCAQYNISLDMLMENAGKAVAEAVRNMVGNLQTHNILILVGPGNNGGDGLVAARFLHDWGACVRVYLCGNRKEKDINLSAVIERDINCVKTDNDVDFQLFNNWLSEATLILDAIFGTGKSRSLSGVFASVLNQVAELKKQRQTLRIVALDLPSGLNADTGAVDPATPYFDNTITLGFPKIGLFNLPGSERIGKLTVVDIGIPVQVVDYIKTELLTEKSISSMLPRRPLVSHKGTYGKVMALVGSINYTGAAFLACTGSIRVGAGLTTLAIPDNIQMILASKLTEVTFLPLPTSERGIITPSVVDLLRQQLPQYDVLLMGCGLGQSQPVADMVKTLLFDPQIKLPPVVLDADGINTIAKYPGWWNIFKDNAVLTPHAGEMSRLLGKPVEDVQTNRVTVTQEAAETWHKTVVLKGAYTVIASPDGKVGVSPFANAGLASAGTGDVLAGAIAGMKAQDLSPFDAAACGVYLHGLAGEILKAKLGDAGMLASDLLPILPLAIRQLKDVYFTI